MYDIDCENPEELLLNIDASIACMTASGAEKLLIFGSSKSKNDGNSNC